MTSWKDNGPVIVPRELRRWSRSRKLPGGPLRIIRLARWRYEVAYHGMRISFRDGRGFVSGAMWPERGSDPGGAASPYRRRAGGSAAFDRYRERRARIMMADDVVSLLPELDFRATHDVRAFLIYGSYVQAVRNMLAFAQMSKARANQTQRGQGYLCLDHRDRLPLELR